MASMYEIGDDIIGLHQLLESLVDEEGLPREPSGEEMETLRAWFKETEQNFEKKFDSYCRYIRSLKMTAENIDAERKSYKAELERLAKRAKASENRAKTLQGLLRWNMERLHMKKFKTDLFTANIQNTQLNIHPLDGASLAAVPECYLKPREIDTTKVKQALKDGELILKDGPENACKIFFPNGEELKNVRAVQGTALVIR